MAEGRYSHRRSIHDNYETLGVDDARTRARQDWFAERRDMRQGQEFRDDTPSSETVYDGFSHEELQRMLTDNFMIGQVGDVSESWSKLANALDNFGVRLRAQVTKTEASWEGAAADGARAYAVAMSEWSERTGEKAQLVSHQVSQEAGAAGMARNSMPEPVSFDMDAETRQWLDNPQAMPDAVPQALERQRQSREAKDEAVRVMHQYDENLYQAASKQPSFSPPPQLAMAADEASTTLASRSGSDGGSAAPTSPSSTTPASSGGSGAGAAGEGSLAGLGRAASGSGSGGAGSGGAAAGGGTASGVPGAATGKPGVPMHGGRTSGSMPFHSGGAGPASAKAPLGGGGRMGPGMVGPMGGAGRGGGKGSDDEEHKRKQYGSDWDNADVWFGDMPKSTPSVIGESLTPPMPKTREGGIADALDPGSKRPNDSGSVTDSRDARRSPPSDA